MNPFRFVCATLLAASLGMAFAAESKPSVDSIIEKHVAAVGGKAAVEKIKSRETKADFVVNDNTSLFEEWIELPLKRAWKLEIEGWGKVEEVLNGDQGWGKDPSGAVHARSGDELARLKRDSDLHRDIKFKALFPNLVYKNTSKFGGADVHLLESKPTATSVERLYFDAKTGLLVRQEAEYIGREGGRARSDVTLEDYKAVDGVKIPHTRHVTMGTDDNEFDFTVKIKEVKQNGDIDDAKFKKPSE